MSLEHQLRSAEGLQKLLKQAEQHHLPEITWVIPQVGPELIGRCVGLYLEKAATHQRAVWEAWRDFLKPAQSAITKQRSDDGVTFLSFKIENYEGLCNLVINARIDE